MATAIEIPRPTFQQRWLLIGLLVFFAAINAQYLAKVSQSERTNSSAIQRWLPQLDEFLHGENIWIKHNFPYPPIMALLLAPLTLAPPLSAALIWFGLKVGMALLSIHLVFTMLEANDRPFPLWGKFLTLLLALRPIEGDLVHGNVNLFILALLAVALFAFTRGRDWLAGFTLGLAIACKVTPALFLPYFVWKRAWKAVGGCLIGLAVFFVVLPGAFLSWQTNRNYLASWYGVMIQPFLLKGEVFYSEHPNQSLPGLAHRLLTHSASFSDYDENNLYRPLEYHNVVAWHPQLVGWLIKGCAGLFALLVICTCRTPLSERRDWRMLAEFGIVLLGMLLFSERTWKHHCVTLLLPFAVLAYLLATEWSDRRLRWGIATVLLLALLLMSSTSTGLFDRHDRAGKLAQVYGAYLWTFFLLLGMLAVVLRRALVTQASPSLPLRFAPAASAGPCDR